MNYLNEARKKETFIDVTTEKNYSDDQHLYFVCVC